MYIFLIALFFISFSLGLESYSMTGIINYISKELGISLSQASYLNSLYFFGLTISGPIMVILLRNINKFLALSIISFFIIFGNIIIYLYPSYQTLVIGRILASFGHSAFFGLSAVIVYRLCSKNKCSGIQIISSATTVANMIGVPIVTRLADSYGWRYSFLFISISCLVGLILIAFTLLFNKNQNIETHNIKTKLNDEIKNLLKNKSAISTLIISFLTYCSFFISISFLSSTITKSLGFSEEELPKILLFIGSGMFFGGFFGSFIYDKYQKKIAPIFLSLSLAITSILISTLHINNAITIILLFIFEFLSFSLVPYFKTKIISNTIDAPNLATTANNVALGFGSACGAIIAGLLIKNYNAIQLPLFSSFILVILTIVTTYNYKLDCKIKKH